MKPTIIFFLFSLSSGVAAQKISSIHDGEFDFSGPKTYDWSKSTKKKMKQFINVPYGSKEIMKYFKEYGYKLEEGSPDLIVDIDVKQSKSMSLQSNTATTRTNVRNRRYRTGSVQVSKPTPVQETKGSFTLKLINPATQDAVWLATGSGEVDEDIDVEKRQKRVNKMIKKMFKKFPGEEKKS